MRKFRDTALYFATMTAFISFEQTQVSSEVMTAYPWSEATILQVQSHTQQELLTLNQDDYSALLDVDISSLSEKVIKQLIFDRTNEIRKQHKLCPLKYSTALEVIATQFAQEKRWNPRWEDRFCHFDAHGDGPLWRIMKSDLKDQIKFTNVWTSKKWVGENLSTANSTVGAVMEALMKSPWHRATILSPYENALGVAYDKEANLIVQLFANIKK